jgi:hypothetical protein
MAQFARRLADAARATQQQPVCCERPIDHTLAHLS